MPKYLFTFSILLFLSCFPTGEEPRDLCKKNYGEGREDKRNENCFFALQGINSELKKSQPNETHINANLFACFYSEIQNKDCDKSTTLPVYIGDIK
ncbi:hypothetical protein CH381_00290 [Leptospira sp. mixed culture ATI2-C-A1]|nr:hypothetical protein CH381_00290 [Leptospira sp. mixed culture ATI2-C-A1]